MRKWAGIAVALAGLAVDAYAQHLSGSFSASNDGGSASISFECTGNNPCVGTYRGTNTPAGCSPHFINDRFIMTGDALPSPSGPVALTFTLVNADEHDPSPCIFVPGGDIVLPLTGQWSGQQGVFSAVIPDPGGPINLKGAYALDTPPPFQLKVDTTITPTVANSTATVQFPDAVVGTTQNLYVFALAPPSIVKRTPGVKDDPSLPCVLAQLNSAGQLVSVSAASLQAFVSGVIAAGSQAYSILNGVPTVNIGGATFFLGYGASPTAMINSGTNRAAVSVSSASTNCRAERPQTGWWWNDKEGGRGFSLETRNGNLFFAGYLYDATGQAIWLAAAGPTTLEGSVFQSDLLAFANGQTMTGPYKAPGQQASPGHITLTFSDASHGVLSWPGGNIGIQRFEIATSGFTLAPIANQPESGWWWNESESGRGYFIEWQGANAFLATYLYTGGGSPTWYAAQVATPDISRVTGPLTSYAGGQTLTGTYRPPSSTSVVGNVVITFSGPDTATLTWPGGVQVPIKRFRF